MTVKHTSGPETMNIGPATIVFDGKVVAEGDIQLKTTFDYTGQPVLGDKYKYQIPKHTTIEVIVK